jgi:hypothetical protein
MNHGGIRDPISVNQGSIGAIQVFDKIAAREPAEAGMFTGYRFVLYRHITGVHAPHHRVIGEDDWIVSSYRN